MPQASNLPPQTPSQGNDRGASAILASNEPRESFSALTLFLFGSGLALFVALLGWSDQIRGIDKDTRELEGRFLESTGIQKRDFVRLVNSKAPAGQLGALTELVNAGKIITADSVQLVRTFTSWNSAWSRIERLSAWKYNLTITLTIALFGAGIGSLFTTPVQEIRFCMVAVRVEMLLLMLPMALIAVLLSIITCGAHREKALRTLVNTIAGMV
jgi:hypothetical protein